MTRPGANTEIWHASAVALNGQSALILGASGSGKSSLALQLMALGAQLVADDRTCLTSFDGVLTASAPAAISGQIEARGVGILAAETCRQAPVKLVIDLDSAETERLPPHRTKDILGVALPLVLNTPGPHFPAAVLLYLRGGRCA